MIVPIVDEVIDYVPICITYIAKQGRYRYVIEQLAEALLVTEAVCLVHDEFYAKSFFSEKPGSLQDATLPHSSLG